MGAESTDHSGKNKLPPEVHADLVETLFGTIGSFLAGLIGGLIVAVIAWFRTHDPIFLICLSILLGWSAIRIAVLILHNMQEESIRRQEARKWEILYAIGGIGFMATAGVTAAILFARHVHDEVSPLFSIVTSLGYAGALAGRNAGRPWIVIGQVLSVCTPLAIAMLLHADAWYWGLAALLILVMISVKSTARFLNEMLVSALLNGREARMQRSRFGAALNSMSHGLCMGDAAGRVTVINHRLQEFFGLEDDASEITLRELAGRIASSGEMSPEARGEFLRAWDEHVARRDSGVFSETIGGRIYDFRWEPMEAGGCVIVVEDVTEARLAAREVERMARFDTLTGLPNRVLFHARLKAVLDRLAEGEQLGLLSVDLDRFKEVNDTLGHPMGDKLLRKVAERLCQAVRAEDMVARFGGDEFQILLQPSSEPPDLDALAKRLIDVLSQRYTVDGHTITIGASVGIAVAPADAAQADELLRCADMALYNAKGAGRGIYKRFTPDMDVAARRKRQIEQELREAIARQELELHYQPIVDTRTNLIVACEALVRWQHPQKGMIPPAEFIQVAEETGLIVEIGDWVLRRACADALLWPEHVRVAVNISARQFVLASDLVGDIREVLQTCGLPPDRLEVEITESTLVESREAVSQLAELFAAGVRLSLDDFGTGYSSLSYLRQFPVHKIKIDRSFVHDLEETASQAVIGSVSFLAELLHMDVVMEGIETEEQLRAVTHRNVHLVQGYYFSKPKPLAELLPMFGTPMAPSAAA